MFAKLRHFSADALLQAFVVGRFEDLKHPAADALHFIRFHTADVNHGDVRLLSFTDFEMSLTLLIRQIV